MRGDSRGVIGVFPDRSGTNANLFAKSGEYWSPIFPANTTAATVAGTLLTFAVYVPVSLTIDRIGAQVTGAAASSTISLGIYNDDGTGNPGSLLLDAGTIDGNSATAQEITISQALVGGNTYHLAAMAFGGTPTVRVLSTGAGSGRQITLANALAGNVYRMARTRAGVASAPLPDPAATTAVASSMPMIAVRIA